MPRKGSRISLRHDDGGTTKNLVYKELKFYSIKIRKIWFLREQNLYKVLIFHFVVHVDTFLSSTIVLAPFGI